MAKQLNILLGNMDVKPTQIVMDPMTGAMGYGIEYTYSVMERIRLTGIGGDKMLAGPMIVSPGQECAKIKEAEGRREGFPRVGRAGPPCGHVGTEHRDQLPLLRSRYPDPVQPPGGGGAEEYDHSVDGSRLGEDVKLMDGMSRITRRSSDRWYASSRSSNPAKANETRDAQSWH